MSYILMTESNSDMPYTIADEYNMHVIKMPYTINDVEYFADLGRGTGQKEFYDAMRAGATPTTSQLNSYQYVEEFEPYLKDGKDILYIAFSTTLSKTHENAHRAIEELLQVYPGRRVEIVDTKLISMAEGLLVIEAYKMYKNGASMDEIITWVNETAPSVNAWFAVDDLKYLKRGGRISGAAAVMGTILDLKPILTLTTQGAIAAFEKVQGRKKAMRALIKHVEDRSLPTGNQTVIILHADCMAEAEKLKELLVEKFPQKDIKINPIGQVIGTHTGPGTLAVIFFGTKRP